jgi:serine/threonine protein kinase
LEKFLASQKTLPEETCIKILYDICLAYNELIKKNIIHRDIKLANIFINDDHYKLGSIFIIAQVISGFRRN